MSPFRWESPVELEDTPDPYWFTGWMLNRNKNEYTNNIIVTGKRGDGKSKTTAAFIMSLDKSFLPSLKNHPYYTKDFRTAKHCHLSVSPIPLLLALKQNLMPKGSWWQIDEPTDIENLDWAKKRARVLGKVLRQYRKTLVNVAIITPRMMEILSILRNFSDVWVDIRERGNGVLWSMEDKMPFKKGTSKRLMMRVPRGLGAFQWPRPSKEFEDLYDPIRDWQYEETLDEGIEELLKGDPEAKKYVV